MGHSSAFREQGKRGLYIGRIRSLEAAACLTADYISESTKEIRIGDKELNSAIWNSAAVINSLTKLDKSVSVDIIAGSILDVNLVDFLRLIVTEGKGKLYKQAARDGCYYIVFDGKRLFLEDPHPLFGEGGRAVLEGFEEATSSYVDFHKNAIGSGAAKLVKPSELFDSFTFVAKEPKLETLYRNASEYEKEVLKATLR